MARIDELLEVVDKCSLDEEEEGVFNLEDKYGRDGRDPDDPFFDYDEEDLEGSRFDPDCEDEPM